MDSQEKSRHILETIGWIILRLMILNTIILLIAFIIAMTRNIFEPTNMFLIRFPFQLYLTTFFLANLVYIIGNIFETVYQRLWNQKIDFRGFERKFFKAGILMIAIVNIAGILIYFINYFN